jgi:flagellar export protein FliJ
MKRFVFPLDRVMQWRRTQARIEELKLERQYAELRHLGHQIEALALERNSAGRTLIGTGGASGLELTLLDAFQKAADAELTRLERSKSGCRQHVEAQVLAVAERRRDVRLLEKLKERKFLSWRIAFNREIDQEAEEAYLARWSSSAG